MAEQKLTQAQKMEMARDLALAMLALPEGAYRIGTAEYAVETEQGYVKVKLTAVKAEDFDPVEAKAEYEYQVEQARVKAEQKKAEADRKKEADIAKKAKAKAEKEKAEA